MSTVVAVSYFVRYKTLLQNATDVFTKYYSCFITKCYKSLLQNASGVLLQSAICLSQNATVITKCDDFLTKCDILLQNGKVITKFYVYYKMRQYIV